MVIYFYFYLLFMAGDLRFPLKVVIESSLRHTFI